MPAAKGKANLRVNADLARDEIKSSIGAVNELTFRLDNVADLLAEHEQGRQFVPAIDFQLLCSIAERSSSTAIYSQCAAAVLDLWRKLKPRPILLEPSRQELLSYVNRAITKFLRVRRDLLTPAGGEALPVSPLAEWHQTLATLEMRAVEALAKDMVTWLRYTKQACSDIEATYLPEKLDHQRLGSLSRAYASIIEQKRSRRRTLNDRRDGMNLAYVSFLNDNRRSGVFSRLVTGTAGVLSAGHGLAIDPIDALVFVSLWREMGGDVNRAQDMIRDWKVSLVNLDDSLRQALREYEARLENVVSEPDVLNTECPISLKQQIDNLRDALDQMSRNPALSMLRQVLENALSFIHDGYSILRARDRLELVLPTADKLQEPCNALALSIERASDMLSQLVGEMTELDDSRYDLDFSATTPEMITAFKKTAHGKMAALRIATNVDDRGRRFYTFSWPTLCGIGGFGRSLEICIAACASLGDSVVDIEMYPGFPSRFRDCNARAICDKLSAVRGRSSQTLTSVRVTTDHGDACYLRRLPDIGGGVPIENLQPTVTLVTTSNHLEFMVRLYQITCLDTCYVPASRLARDLEPKLQR